jgi:hypothetical protein
MSKPVVKPGVGNIYGFQTSIRHRRADVPQIDFRLGPIHLGGLPSPCPNTGSEILPVDSWPAVARLPPLVSASGIGRAISELLL